MRSPPSQRSDSAAKKAKTQSAVELARTQVQRAADEGWRLVYVDESSKQPWKGSKHRAGGIGISSQADSASPVIRISELLPMKVRQTNSVAELWRGLQVLQRVPEQKLAVISDSEYLTMGAQGKVQEWQGMAWVGTGHEQYPCLRGVTRGNRAT